MGVFTYKIGFHFSEESDREYFELESFFVNPISVGDHVTENHGDEEFVVFGIVHEIDGDSVVHVREPV